VQQQLQEDSQLILPSLILTHTPVWIQILFFGAVLSAIMSTASGTLLAPSVTFAENVARGFLPEMEDHKFLRFIRLCVLGFSGIVLAIALNSELSIFEMVENAYKITLVGAIVPLFAGLFWKRANEGAALLSISLGIGVWVLCEIIAPEGTTACPPQLAGFAAATLGMVTGGFLFGKKV
jgi:Na+/proline symporter